jgi:hypothetical protein
LPQWLKPDWHSHLRHHATGLFEVLIPSVELMQLPTFLPFGLADGSIFGVAADTLILTEDFRLSGFLHP